MKTVVACICTFLGASCCLTAQHSENTIPFSGVTSLQVVLVGPPSCHSLIGAKIDATGPESLSIAEVNFTYRNYRGVPLPQMPHVSALAADRFALVGSKLSVSCSARADTTLVIHASATTPINISVANSFGVLANVRVLEGIIIRDGIAESATSQGLADLILRSTFPFTPSSSTPGVYGKLIDSTISLTDAKAHLRSYARPTLNSTRTGIGVLRLEIDETGHVSGVTERSFPLFDAHALDTVRGWAFEPFAPAGKPIKVIAAIPFHVDAAGVVITGLDPSAKEY